MAGLRMGPGLKMKESIERIVKAHGFLDEFGTSNNFHLEVLNEPYMKLVIERHGDEVAVAHTFIQNGDVMCDPEIVFAIPVWEAIEITQHPMGQYRRKYQMDGSVKRVNVNFERNVHPLVSLWARNLKAQGYHHTTCVVRSITHPRSAAA